MKRKCPSCANNSSSHPVHGFFVRKSDRRPILRFKCKRCGKTFSQSTRQLCYWQKKRKLNPRIFEYLCSGLSQRRIAFLLKISRTTVVRKLLFLANHCRDQNKKDLKRFGPISELQFDDLETFEHTKCKPLSLVMAVDKSTRRIFSFAVSQMPAKGHLAKIARKKYGYRADLRTVGWDQVFAEVSRHVSTGTVFESDQNPHYPNRIKKWCPQVKHLTYEGKRGCIVGQGELKKTGFDPLFSLNHTFAMCRANINRLFRKTWCTTKRIDRLAAHLELYVNFHNRRLISKNTNSFLTAPFHCGN